MNKAKTIRIPDDLLKKIQNMTMRSKPDATFTDKCIALFRFAFAELKDRRDRRDSDRAE